jgi:hypothetical protein
MVGFVEKHIARLNRKAQKLGLDEITLHKSGVITTVIEKTDPATGRTSKREIKLCDITVCGEEIKLSGWALVGELSHDDVPGKVVLRSCPGSEIPTQYRDATPDNCDHCHVNRRRNDTFIVRNTSTGEYRQIGRTCIKDFLGGNDPNAIASYATAIMLFGETLESSASEDGWFSGRSECVVTVKEVLDCAVAMIRTNGWVSRSMARENPAAPRPTADWVWWWLAVEDPEGHRKFSNQGFSITDEDCAFADEALAWAAALSTSGDVLNDYLYNVSIVTDYGYVSEKTIGVATSIVASYSRNRQIDIERQKTAAESNHFGTVGKREVFTLTVTGVRYIDTSYGPTGIVNMKDETGNVAVWFCSKCSMDGKTLDSLIGGTLRIKATVKNHSVYKGVKQTVLSRCNTVS